MAKVRNKLNQVLPASIFGEDGKEVYFNFGPKEIRELDPEKLTPAGKALLGKYIDIIPEVEVSKPTLSRKSSSPNKTE